MNDRKQEIEAIFHAAAELDSPEQREIYLNRACGGDAKLRSEVETLLRAVQRADEFFDDPALAGSPLSSSTILANEDAPARSVNLTECPGTIIGRYKLLQRIGARNRSPSASARRGA
jgi:eukaryotic-like serine/threonine-protein kinase